MLTKVAAIRESKRYRQAMHAALISVLLITVAGCEIFTPPKPPRIGEERRYLVHLVSSNYESFGKISKWYTGSEKFGKELAEINSKVAGNGLQSGESVLIPFASLKTVAPMPKAVGTKKNKSTKKGKKKGSAPLALDSVELQSDEMELEPTTPEHLEVEVQPDQTAIPVTEPTKQQTDEPKDPMQPQDVDVVPLPTGLDNESKSADNLSNGGKSLEQLVREEQAELERLKREMDAQ